MDEEICVWVYDENHDKWDTDCDESFQFTNGRPRENGMIFCAFCGRALKQGQMIKRSYTHPRPRCL